VFAQQDTALAGIRLLNIGTTFNNLNKFLEKFEAFDPKQKSEHKARFFEIPNRLGLCLDYFKSDKTDCEDWFACANIAVAAWAMIWLRAMLVVSVA
jgi:nitrate reductase assembly molybdenum cofactor insertion protein NarJ